MLITWVFLVGLNYLPAQPAGLALTNARLTYGIQGPTRTSDRFLPGDNVVLCFDIEGATVNSEGKVKYAVGMEVLDQTGKVRFRQASHDLETTSKPGASLPACANGQVGFHQAPGRYTIRVHVTDRANNSEQQVSRDVEVAAKSFGIVRVGLSRDEEGNLSLPALKARESAWLNFALVGFSRDQGRGQPNVSVELRLTDEAGNPAFKDTIKGSVSKGVAKQAQDVPLQFELKLARAGKYKLELNAVDKISGKQAVVSFPLSVESGS
jgi:hypothetical protein